MREETITLAIFEKYPPDELAETAQKLVQAMADQETAETEKKLSDAVFNERIKKHGADAAMFAKQYGKGGESAQIGCDIRYDHPEPGKKSYFQMDRNELVETHDMSWEEKQETLQFPLTASADSETIAQPTDEQVNGALDKLAEETTRLCTKTPGCIHFADHEGPCDSLPTEPPCQEPPQPGAGTD
jgi:hypothetical protein